MPNSDCLLSPTHVAYADETSYNVGRYRGLCVVSTQKKYEKELDQALRRILCDSNISEFKWEKLRTAKTRFGALAMLNFTVRKACEGIIRVDSLTWDTEDRRHQIPGRDDIANMQRMYYHLFRNVMCVRWPDGSSWCLYPDENTALEWQTVADYLEAISIGVDIDENLFTGGTFKIRLKEEFKINEIMPCLSHTNPLAQLADLFAGLGVYSRSCYDKFESWMRTKSSQVTLFEGWVNEVLKGISSADQERCRVLAEFNAQCKRYRLGVSLKSNRGLRTFDPYKPINFWWYVPQHEKDRAPTRRP